MEGEKAKQRAEDDGGELDAVGHCDLRRLVHDDLRFHVSANTADVKDGECQERPRDVCNDQSFLGGNMPKPGSQ